jgi:hypothetical protein
MCARDFSADGSSFADVIFGPGCGDLVALCCGAKRKQEENKGSDHETG